MPSISFFSSLGYTCPAIDIDKKQLERAQSFCNEYNLKVSFERADMRRLPYPNNTFSFAFSFNTIFHMKKEDIYKSISEMARITAPGGLIYFNLLSTEDSFFGEGKQIGPGEFEQEGHDGTIIHSYFEKEECDYILSVFELVCKDERKSTIVYDGEPYVRGDIDYFLRIPLVSGDT